MRRPDMKQIFNQFNAEARSCAGCGGEFDGIGTFVPNDQSSVAAPADKMRVFFYPCCHRCIIDPLAIEKIEAGLVQTFHTAH